MTDNPHVPAPAHRLPGAARAAGFSEPAYDEPAPPIRRPFATTNGAAPTGESEPDTAPKTGAGTASIVPKTALSPETPTGATPPQIAVHQGTGAAQAWDRFQTPLDGLGAPPKVAQPLVGWTVPPQSEKPAEWGRKRIWVRLLTLGLVKAKPGYEEREYRENVRIVRQQTWPRCVRILVANPKGGSGKTPTAMALAGVLAQIRGGGVLAWDASQSPGDLGQRSEGRQAMCLSDVVANPQGFNRPGTMAAAVSTQSSFADVLASLRPDRMLDAVSVQRAQWAIDQTYRISIADSGANESRRDPGGAFRELIDNADQLVIPVTATKASVDAALSLLDEYATTRVGRSAVVVVLDYRGPTTVGLPAVIGTLFAERGIPAERVVHIPFDPAIAAGTEITLSDLTHDSKVAWTRLAATTLRDIVIYPGRP